MKTVLRSTFRQQEIQIAGDWGWGIERKPLPALVSGALAVHRSVNKEVKPWTVTHIGTGYIVTYAPTRKLALAAATALQRLDWNFRSAQSRKIQRMRPAVRRILNQLRKKP